MTMLIAAVAVFVLMHFLISGTRLRGVLVGVVGEGAYMGLFSLASLAAIVWLSMAYGAARGTGELYWTAPAWGAWVQAAIQLVALLMVVIGVTTPNPTSVKQEAFAAKPATGMLRVTRHPFLWGVALWALGHLLVNGDGPGLVLFGGMAILAAGGTWSIDAKRRRAMGDAWTPFAAQTSNIPFAAILAGRQSLRLGEIGWWRIALGLAVWAALLWGHGLVFGVPALP